MTEPDIHALTDGATIYAQYTKDNVAKYTVTAPEGATLTVDGVETASLQQLLMTLRLAFIRTALQHGRLTV